jgi:hypothetical protein
MIEEVPPPYSEIDVIAENRAIVDNVLNHVREVEEERQNYLRMMEALATRIKEMKQGVTPKEIIDFYIEYHDGNETFANAIGDDIREHDRDNTNIMNWVNCDKTQKDLKKFMRKRHKIEDWKDFGINYYRLDYEKTEFVNVNGGKFRVTFEKDDDYPLFMIKFTLSGRNRTKMILD